MNFLDVKIEKVIPLFTGALGSLFFCAVIAVHMSFFKGPELPEIIVAERQSETITNFLNEIGEKIPDQILEIYRNPEYRDWALDFFTGICSNREIAQAVMDTSDEFEVPPALAFALSWEESHFNPRAISPRNGDGSVDRGLFQLNSRSFPGVETTAFFDVKINSFYAISHLRHCLDSGGSEVSALAMYNAGAGRVRDTGTPKVTLDYISRILENRKKIENRFHSSFLKEEESRLAEEENSESP